MKTFKMLSFIQQLSCQRVFVLLLCSLHCKARRIVSKKPVYQNLNYLVEYGYISARQDVEKPYAVRKAIENFQMTFNLSVTGYLDDKTINLMKTPRCGLPDNSPDFSSNYKDCGKRKKKKTSDAGESEEHVHTCETTSEESRRKKRFQLMGKWPKTKFTYGFFSYTDKMSKIRQQKEIANAFKVWSEGTPLTFEKRDDGIVDISFSFQRGSHGDGYPFDGPGKTLAHAFFPGPDTTNGEIHFDADERWTYPSLPNGTDLQAVAVHEIGHALGLGHSRHPDSVMQPYYHTKKKVLSLGEDDRRAINVLYGENFESENLISDREKKFVVETPTLPKNQGYTDGPECDMVFDAVSNIRNEIFFFKGDRFWRFTVRGEKFFNVSMSRFWLDFPSVKVDAVFARDEKTFIFSGIHFWSYTNNYMDRNYPKPISEFGLPMNGGIDAAFVWKNVSGETYFIKNSKYWKYEKELPSRIAYGYPKDIEKIGISPNIDGAFSDPDNSEVYFLKGKYCRRLNRNTLRVSEPERIGVKWFGCKPDKNNRRKRVWKSTTDKQTPAQTIKLPTSDKQIGDNSGNGAGTKSKFNSVATLIFIGTTFLFKLH